jgi:hypothetical protein
MPLIVPDEGERRLLEYLVGKTAPGNLVLHLYTNSVDLSTETFTASSFTEAASVNTSSSSSATGYQAVTLQGSNWTSSTIAGVSAAVYNTSITFTFSNAQSIYGYYVTDTSNRILWAEEFPGAPFTLPSTGGEISIRPQVQLN